MANATIFRKHLELNGQKYYLAAAENMRLGSFGNKRYVPFTSVYLDEQGLVPMEDIPVESPTLVSIDFRKSQGIDAEGEVPFKVAEGQAGLTFEQMKQGKVVLLKLLVRSEVLRKAINENEALIGQFQTLLAPRLVNQVFVIAEASFARSFTNSVRFSATVSNGLQTISGGGGGTTGGEESLLSISQGTIFAYGLLRPIFDKAGKAIVRFETDQLGLG